MKRFGIFGALALGVSCPLMASCQTRQGQFALNESNVSMSQYEEYALSCSYKGLDVSDVTWSSSDNTVVTVSEGVLTSCGVGRASITATYLESSYRCEVLVTRSTVGRALVVSESVITLDYLLQEEKQVSATLKENGVELEANIVWESSDPSVVVVSSSGLVKSVGRGSAMISAFCMHKGQKFQKSILVKSVAYSSTALEFDFPEASHVGTSLTAYDDTKTQYFPDGGEVYRYDSAGGAASRLFVDGAFDNGVPKNDRLVFQIKFDAVPTLPMHFMLGNAKNTILANTSLATEHTSFLFFDYKGRIADGLRLTKNYYVVVNLNDISEGSEFGFYFEEATSCYVASPILCSDDYLFELKGFEKPYELPKLNYCYAESRIGLPLGDEKIEGINGSYWVMNTTGSPVWDENAWENRVTIGGITYSEYRLFNYQCMNVMFPDPSFTQMVFWTGGYSFYIDTKLNKSSSETGTYQDDDLRVYEGERLLSVGEQLRANVDYTFKVRIQKKDTENVAFGINVISASTSPIYLSNPTFQLI
ncbi:MAG: Ig-like domain-containing protein [Candidatus Enteromonas sp.]|nr:Ig-like domain-containing protein [Candidatus Enteromonas sp.]